MQGPQSHMISPTNELLFLEVHHDDCEVAEDPLKSALSKSIKKTHCNNAVWQISRNHPEIFP